MKLFLLGVALAAISGSSGAAFESKLELPQLLTRAAQSCKAMRSCREAVQAWCNGYKGADRDDDGIPCENVCKSKAQVDKIKVEIGC